MRSGSRLSWAIALVVLATWSARVAIADEGQQQQPPSHAFLDMTGRITPVGDIELSLSMRPTPERWKLLKHRYNTPEMLFRDILSHHSAMETQFPDPVEFDERNLRIKTRMNLLGYARNEGDGEWMIDLALEEGQQATSFQRTEADGLTTLAWSLEQRGEGVIFEVTIAVALPENATNVRVDEGTAVFRYTLARPEGEGRPRLDTQLRVKPRILTGAYKAYAMKDAAPDQWLAKAILRNTGPSVVRRLRVRFRIQGYSEWGLWSKFPEVVPGQTVVVPYHPVLDAKVAQLQSKTPTNVMFELRYEDKDGKEYEDTDGARATMMGGHEFYFTNYRAGEYANWYEAMTENSSLLAAWVSREDAAVDEFAAMANRIAGGSPSHTSPQAAVATLHGIYELWVRNDFVYVSPPGVVDKSVSFDPKFVQNIKYPRDVIRDKAGTCIDLAILFASMAASQGLEPYLALVPGHCFPVFLLPQKRGQTERMWLPIEATGIMGGLGPRVHSWPEIVKAGEDQLAKVFAGEMPGTLIPVAELWSRGVTGPELPPLPADILKRWDISEGSGPIRTAGGATPQGGGQPAQPQGHPVVGTWVGTQTFSTTQGAIPAQMRVVIAPAPNGGLAFEAASLLEASTPSGQVRLASKAMGNVVVQGSTVTFQILRGTTKNLITGQTVNDEPATVTLTLQGNSMSGRTTSPDGYPVQFALRRE